MSAPVEVRAGQVWVHRRESWRRLTITKVVEGGERVEVLRSTSRRRQAVKRSTLLRQYRLRAPLP